MRKRTIIFRHVCGWLIYILYEIMSVGLTAGLHGPMYHFPVYYTCYISLFYFNAHVILDFAFFKTSRPYLISAGLMILEALLFYVLKAGLDCIMPGVKQSFDVIFSEPYFLANLFREIFFIGFSTAYWSMLSMVHFMERNHKMETEQLKSMAKTLELQNKYISVENAFLQNQISPHLLFNSLSFIYTSVRRLSDKAGNGVMLLSDLLRYSLITGGDTKSVLLSKEVEQIENLINLSRLRLEDHFYLQFKRSGKLAGIKIIPLLLITLVENVIKHGELGDKKNPARATLTLHQNKLHFLTSNIIRKSSPYTGGGLGLNNLQKRLNNAYPDSFELHLNDTDGFFLVSLTIIL